jgi:hypothetical protein
VAATTTPRAGTATPGARTATPTFVDIVLGATPPATPVISRLPSTGAGGPHAAGYLAVLGACLITAGVGIVLAGARSRPR